MLESVGPVGYVIRKLNQVRQSGDRSQSRLEVIEIIEAAILALVAVATAWSGYQAAKWAGNRAEQYANASRFRVTAEGLATLAGQERIYDSDTFNSWLAAKLDGKSQTAEFFERRFRDEYHYVRITVLLATVLLITAIGQRFHFKAVRIVFMILACLLLCLPLLRLLMLPRI